MLYDDEIADPHDLAAALRQIARGLTALAAALEQTSGHAGEPERARTLLREWGNRGLTRAEASALFRRHGFAPQTAGGWARSDWIETRDDGLRYVTDSSRQWLAASEEEGDD